MARTEAQRAAERRYDAKRKNARSRTWGTIVYPESAASGWVDKLRDTGLQALISPLHDQDPEEGGAAEGTGDLKKEHWHVLIRWPNPVSLEQAMGVIDQINGVGWLKVESLEGQARYLTHKDHPHKHQYSDEDVTIIGAIDYFALITSTSDDDAMFREMRIFIRENHIETLAELYDISDEQHPEWSRLLNRKLYPIREYIKENRVRVQLGNR